MVAAGVGAGRGSEESAGGAVVQIGQHRIEQFRTDEGWVVRLWGPGQRHVDDFPATDSGWREAREIAEGLQELEGTSDRERLS